MYTPGQIINEQDVERLIFLGQVASDAVWEMGDITNRYLAALEARKEAQDPRYLGIGKMDIYEYVAGLTGKSARSIRLYSTVAAFYPQEERDQFGVLRFKHFAAAMPHKQWKDMLEWAVRAQARDGLIPSVERMEWTFRASLQDTYQQEMLQQPLPDEPSTAEEIMFESAPSLDLQRSSPSVRGGVLRVWGLRFIDKIRKEAVSLRITQESKRRLETALDTLEAVLEEIGQENPVAQ